MWQARHVRDRLLTAQENIDLEIIEIKSDGDQDVSTPLTQMGSIGIFTQTLERALRDDRIDVAVHSLKDVPGEIAEGTAIVAYGKREDPRDAWFHRDGVALKELSGDVVVATGSMRRRSQLLHRFGELSIVDLRGNLDTRWSKFQEGQFDAMILAAAGVKRLGWSERVTEWLPVEEMLPAVGQGTLGLQTREDDRRTRASLAILNDPASERCALAERALLRRVAGGCVVPLAGYCIEESGALWMRACLGRPDGSSLLRAEARGKDSLKLGQVVGEQLLSQGGAEIIAAAKAGG
jgi:hydroxymethylbilane synthase